jgi:purine-binding chemotaxis protein CheW
LSPTTSALKLVFRSDRHICALALPEVIETLRPLAVKPVASAPAGVRGISIIRGEPVVVVDLATLLGAQAGEETRWILMRVGERRIALAVDDVLGIREVDPEVWKGLPPLLHGADAGIVKAIGARDAELILALRAGSILPEAAWETLKGRQL